MQKRRGGGKGGGKDQEWIEGILRDKGWRKGQEEKGDGGGRGRGRVESRRNIGGPGLRRALSQQLYPEKESKWEVQWDNINMTYLTTLEGPHLS